MSNIATHFLNLSYNWYHYGSKKDQLGNNVDPFIRISSADALGFSVAI